MAQLRGSTGVLFLTALELLLLAHHASCQCPRVCSCVGVTNTVDCTPNPAVVGFEFKFTFIPTDVPADTRVLIMTGNSLSTLLPGSFNAYPQLETLVLNDNLFTELPENGLNISQLTNLTLDGNPLTDLEPGRLSGLTSLQHLYVRRTPLTTINGSAFEGLTNLVNLFLDDNELTDLPSDLLVPIPQLRLLSLTGNNFQSLSNDFFSPLNTSIAQVDLTNTPWSCDCFLQPLVEFLSATPNLLVDDASTVCQWPPTNSMPPTRISSVPLNNLQCYEPTISQGPQNTTLLSNQTLTLTCNLDGAPFPEVTWFKDGIPLNYTARVHIGTFSASLQFESLLLSDSGEYQCSVANVNGTDESNTATLTVLEWTCFNEVQNSHETDVDCGGEFCSPCNITQGCLEDRDCLGELVCLYAHQIPSTLLYISPHNVDAYTCAEPSLPPTLLETILQTELPSQLYSTVSGEDNAAGLESSVHDSLAAQLQVARTTISNVQVRTVEKYSRPLVQIYFDLSKNRDGMLAQTRLLEQIDSGELKITARIKEEANTHSVRMNL